MKLCLDLMPSTATVTRGVGIGEQQQQVTKVVALTVRWHERGSAITDLAAIGACSHAIVSLGTYSWWGGFLTGGKVLCWLSCARVYVAV